ncbi:MAG: NRDE family protein, partial [Holophagales bacterium]|nr:NRDE family protein [Holophagales bacterium]
EVLMPVDTDAGGTWISVNRHGLALALLNRYQDTPPPHIDGGAGPRPLRSRGLLVRELAGSGSAERVFEGLAAIEVARHAPFSLLVLEPSAAWCVSWNGRQLSAPERPVAPLASSGHDPLGVPEVRLGLWRQTFGNTPPDRRSCLELHRGHRPERGAASPCMHRSDARTVSFTHVLVSRERVAMSYADGPPCSAAIDYRLGASRLSAVAAA